MNVLDIGHCGPIALARQEEAPHQGRTAKHAHLPLLLITNLGL